MVINLDNFDWNSQDLYAKLLSPEYSSGLNDLFEQDESEEEKRRRMGSIGNPNQFSSDINPQFSYGLQEKDPNMFDMFYL